MFNKVASSCCRWMTDYKPPMRPGFQPRHRHKICAQINEWHSAPVLVPSYIAVYSFSMWRRRIQKMMRWTLMMSIHCCWCRRCCLLFPFLGQAMKRSFDGCPSMKSLWMAEVKSCSCGDVLLLLLLVHLPDSSSSSSSRLYSNRTDDNDTIDGGEATTCRG